MSTNVMRKAAETLFAGVAVTGFIGAVVLADYEGQHRNEITLLKHAQANGKPLIDPATGDVLTPTQITNDIHSEQKADVASIEIVAASTVVMLLGAAAVAAIRRS